MSILVFGQNQCPICEKPIVQGEEFYSFPAFIINTNDPMYVFNDATAHKQCIINHPWGRAALQYSMLFVEKIKPANRICIITGKAITEYKRHIFVEYLTSHEDDYLHKLNFAHIDRINLPMWDSRSEVIFNLVRLLDSGIWQEREGVKYLEKLIEKLKYDREN